MTCDKNSGVMPKYEASKPDVDTESSHVPFKVMMFVKQLLLLTIDIERIYLEKLWNGQLNDRP